MAVSLQSKRLLRYTITRTRNYCENKSIYEKHEKGKQPRTVYGKPYPEWRKPWAQRDGEWTSKLSIFVEKNPSMHVMHSMHQLPNLTWNKIKNWWSDMKVIQEIKNQEYIPERTAILGANLAAVHVFAYRGAAVR